MTMIESQATVEVAFVLQANFPPWGNNASCKMITVITNTIRLLIPLATAIHRYQWTDYLLKLQLVSFLIKSQASSKREVFPSLSSASFFLAIYKSAFFSVCVAATQESQWTPNLHSEVLEFYAALDLHNWLIILSKLLVAWSFKGT